MIFLWQQSFEILQFCFSNYLNILKLDTLNFVLQKKYNLKSSHTKILYKLVINLLSPKIIIPYKCNCKGLQKKVPMKTCKVYHHVKYFVCQLNETSVNNMIVKG